MLAPEGRQENSVLLTHEYYAPSSSSYVALQLFIEFWPSQPTLSIFLYLEQESSSLVLFYAPPYKIQKPEINALLRHTCTFQKCPNTYFKIPTKRYPHGG